MAKILSEEKVKKFVEDHQIEAFSIIIKIDEEKKEASYIIDGQKEIKGNYDVLKQYL